MDAAVIIIGGGPVGLWASYELRLAGISVIVLESDLEISNAMRGATIHTRTMEVFTMRGIHEDLLENSGKLVHAAYGQLPTPISFATQDSDYPFVVMQIQPRTTAVIQKHAIKLGLDIRRGHAATEIHQSKDSVSVTVRNDADGSTYELKAQYLIGADGADSMVRKKAGITFEGEGGTVWVWGDDLTLTDPPSTLPGSLWSPEGSLTIFPLPGGKFRVAGMNPDNVGADGKRVMDFDDLRDRVVRIAGKDFGMHHSDTISSTSTASLIASKYREGRIFIAGDAAHRHSPTGGMGMNVGIQDAMNLGWKLAAVINGLMPPSLLDTYEAERWPVGRELLRQTRALTGLGTLFGSDGIGIRELFDGCIQNSSYFNNYLAEHMSGLFVRYASTDSSGHALVGARVPNLVFTDNGGARLYPLFKSGRYLLLTLTSQPLYNGEYIVDDKLPVTYCSRNLDRTATKAQEWGDIAAALIRPDGHVAWAKADSDLDDLRKEISTVVEKTFSKEPSSASAD
ncbi:FAD binding domain-containing protein [Penicillium cataractarum]|uniref:FAD binding domain-containing protein n=1 Tax=Penicillium cataractarum TaxID=2100454 RepID=A0A9W9VW44_9EURO|nr:FAD binding domain-containing protein [Penicillium cataractarum]KAJ5390461.1 FAD binding domain-containing protein [Penicillium cataractarum]